ncbi:MAG: carboxy terminal-processing peptidase [Pseudomonadota bacterium]|nr:carboxy terminal-processing peptidase [Pseudomonadota bacterium]
MRQRLLSLVIPLVLVFLAGAAGAQSQDVPVSDLVSSHRQQKTTMVINKVLERFHYRKISLDDDFASQIFENYIEALDPNRSFFLKGDVDRFKRKVYRLDDNLKRGKLDSAFEIFRLYRQRVDERVDYAVALLDKRFDFDRREDYRFDRSEARWAKNTAELDEIWHKRVKNDWLGLRLAKKSDDKIVELLRERYEGLARRIRQFDSDDVFQAFVNAYTQSLEPHTSYMSPSTSENFDISMRLSLEGIGAVLRGDSEYTVIQRTIAGGPARQSGQIHSGDRIIGVAQGLDGAMEDVIGWRLQDVVDKIRGPKGSVVRLQILPKSAGSDGVPREISLVRNEIKLEDQAAKRYVFDDLDNARGVRIGVIEIPAFYRDFRAESQGKRDFRSTTRDVRLLLRELAREAVDGIVVDLRGNGGGSLTEATALTGLFIDEGPVVQVKDSFGKVEVETDPNPGVVYTGPLAVLVDRNSASASEIFSGAMQDYGRGLVIGEPTFGKGTVQTLVDLNRYVSGNDDDLGRLRLTMAEFFRISGGSTQLRGVVPDIEFPTADDISDHGERALDNPLPWARIRPADYEKTSVGEVDTLRQRSRARVLRDPGFEMLSAREGVLRELDDQTVVSLRERDRRVESKRRERVLKDQRNQFLRSQGVRPVDEDEDDVDEAALEKQQEVISRIQAREAARILADSVRVDGANRPRAVMSN